MATGRPKAMLKHQPVKSVQPDFDLFSGMRMKHFYHNLQKVILLVALLAICSAAAKAQILTLGTVDAGPYTPGSSIAVPFKVDATNGCIKPDNIFELYISSVPGGIPDLKIGSYKGFYTTYVNGMIPTDLIPGSYNLAIKSTQAPVTSSIASVNIVVGLPVVAKITSNANSTPNPQYPDVFGNCSGGISSYIFSNSATAGATNITATVHGEITGSNASLQFVSNNASFSAGNDNYTIFVTANSGTTIGTRAYQLINNQVTNIFGSDSSNPVCIKNGAGVLVYKIPPGSVKNNYRGNLYTIDWGDGTYSEYTYCDLDKLEGNLPHSYTSSSCASGNTNHKFTVSAGISSKICSTLGQAITTSAVVVLQPENNFEGPNDACLNAPVTFTNKSFPGQDASSANCENNNALYTWYVDGNPIVFDQPLNASFTYTFTTPGLHEVKLVFQSQSNTICGADDFKKEICILAPPRPDFSLAATTICNTEIVTPTDLSYVDQTCHAVPQNSAYSWTITGPQGAITPVFINNTSSSSTQPQIKFTTAGVYTITLSISTLSCGVVSTSQTITVDAPPTVSLSPDNSFCGINQTLIFDPNATNTKTTFGGTATDQLNTYSWTVTADNGQSAAVFTDNTTSSTKYPHILFTGFGTYTVTATQTNNCGTASDVQKITFLQAPTVSAGSDKAVCPDVPVQLQGAITGPTNQVTSITWMGGSGYFSDIHSLSSTYTPSDAERIAGQVTLTLRVTTSNPQPCDQIDANIVITIFPENKGNNAAKSICTGNQVNFQPSSSVAGSTFTWTSTATNASGNTTNSSGTSGSITDGLTNIDGLNNGTVVYTITPTANGCQGTPFTLTVTVTPRPVLSVSPTTICSGQPAGLVFNSNLNPTTYKWTSVASAGITGNSNQTIAASFTGINEALTNTNTTAGTVIYTITPVSAADCEGTAVTVTVTVQPLPATAVAGPDQQLCSQTSAQLAGNNPGNSSGMWTEVSGETGYSFDNPTRYDTKVNGLQAGHQYKFRWTITGLSPCAATSSDVLIKDLTPLTNTISYSAPTVCYGQTVTVSGSTSGGTGNYIYSWESSTDGTNWTPVNGASGASYSFTGTQSIYVHRLVGSFPCSSISAPVYIEVQQPISNNIINDVPAICYNNAPAIINGSTPGGADGNYLYQWQKSEDNGTTWQSIASANGINYQPPALTITTKFQRIVSTNLCNGLQQSTSNAVTVTVAALNTNIITSDANRSICTGATLNYHITARDANTSFTWVSSVTSGTVSGNTASGNTVDISDVLVNADPNNNGTVTYTITPINNNCPATPFTLTVTVTPLPRLSLNRTSNTICSGSPSDIIFTSNAATFKWTSNASAGISGNGNQLNPTSATGINDRLINTLQTAGTVTYTITPFSATGCEGPPATVTITVQPAPIPAQAGTDDAICSANFYQLQGNNPQTFTGSWSLVSSQTGVTFDNAGQYNTTARGLQPGQNYVFRWTISGAAQCAVTSDDVVINNLNSLTNTISSLNPTICYGQAVTLNGDQPTGGNFTYRYSWESSTDNGASWNPITGQTGQNLSITLNTTTSFRRIVTSGPCSSYSNVVQIVVQPRLAGNTISANQTICYNTAPAALTGGNTLTGGDGNYLYQWQSSTNNGSNWLSITSANGADYQPTTLTATTQFRRIVSTSLCNGLQESASNVVTISVKPLNTNTLTSTPALSICTGSPLNYHPTAVQSNTVFTWYSSASASITGNTANGTGDIHDVLVNNDPVNNGTVTYTITPINNNCPGTPFTLTITVTPIPQIILTNSGKQICSGNPTGITFNANIPGTLIKWTFDPVAGISGMNNQFPVIATGINDVLISTLTTPATVVYHLTPISATGCVGPTVDATVTVLPIPVTAKAGADEAICSSSTYTLNGNNPLPSTGIWTLTSGQNGVGFADATRYNTAVSGLVPGQQYTFRWTITSTGACSTSTDAVVITDLVNLTNNISFRAPAVCYGQTISVIGEQPTGGNGSYVYTWESSADNANWTTIRGATGINYTFTATSSIYFRRMVTSGPCSSVSQPVHIVVQQPITENTVGSSQEVCYNNTPKLFAGSTPAGADGKYFYQWQSSTDNGANWSNISGANGINYQINSLTVTTQFRRVVTSALCTGDQQSISNTINVMVNPLVDPTFTFTGDLGCIPYKLDAANIKATAGPGNATYSWFADGVQIGTGLTFPGYTITEDNKHVVIKLLVTSRFGCPDASFAHTFSTIQEVKASFSQDQNKGCGPLTVTFNNTSTPKDQATYTWNFGNGQTSTLVNPIPVTYQPRNDGKDTTFVITLKALTACGIRTYTSTVLVRPKPISIFTPDRTIGCSPFTVNFNNTSPGINNTYTFDFGDGQTLVTRDNQNVIHTYVSTTAKTFVVKMTAQNECGISVTQYNLRISPNSVLPQLVVNGDQKAGCAPWTVNFYNNTKGGNYFTYDFGDGTTQSTQSAPEVVTHTFLKSGTFNVKLTATNGCADTATYQVITVYPQPKSNFSADVLTGCSRLSVNFKNTTPGTGNSYVWDFGDGGTASVANPQHTFTARNTPFTITLIAKNGLGCTDTMVMKNYITVTIPPKAIFTTKPDSVIAYPYYNFDFVDKSTNTPILWKWSFGDGTSSSRQNPGHTYRDTGIYKVQLVVYNFQGCADTVMHKVQITGVPGQLFVPNAFMPTSKFNEVTTFKVKGSGLKTWRFRVFNKWGQVIWETTKLTERGEPAEGWDGMMGGQPAPQGVYVWQIEGTYINGKEWTGMSYNHGPPSRQGIIHLIR